MTKAERRQLGRFVGTGPACAVNLAVYLKSKAPKRKPASHHKHKTLSRKGARAALVAEVRPQVEARANGVCECGCGRAFDDTIAGCATWDEFYGRKRISVQETWMLRWEHHECKGLNFPTRPHWDDLFAIHCKGYGYPPPRKRLTKSIARLPSRTGPHDRMERSVETAGGRSTLSTEVKP